jgi:hypothetical protein
VGATEIERRRRNISRSTLQLTDKNADVFFKFEII